LLRAHRETERGRRRVSFCFFERRSSSRASRIHRNHEKTARYFFAKHAISEKLLCVFNSIIFRTRQNNSTPPRGSYTFSFYRRSSRDGRTQRDLKIHKHITHIYIYMLYALACVCVFILFGQKSGGESFSRTNPPSCAV